MAQESLRRKKRELFEILLSMMEAMENGARKTRIMYHAILSHDLLVKYLNFLMNLGLVEERDGVYYLTEKGKKVLRLLRTWKQKKDEYEQAREAVREVSIELKRLKDQGVTSEAS
jgi:predicted transcriptional regulator